MHYYCNKCKREVAKLHRHPEAMIECGWTPTDDFAFQLEYTIWSHGQPEN